MYGVVKKFILNYLIDANRESIVSDHIKMVRLYKYIDLYKQKEITVLESMDYQVINHVGNPMDLLTLLKRNTSDVIIDIYTSDNLQTTRLDKCLYTDTKTYTLKELIDGLFTEYIRLYTSGGGTRREYTVRKLKPVIDCISELAYLYILINNKGSS